MNAVSRRELLHAGAALAGGVGLIGGPAGTAAAWSRSEREIVLTATVTGSGHYLYLPFDVPEGVNRVAVSMRTHGTASLGLGLFDQRGPDYGSAGFRGVYGEEDHDFFVSADRASRSFRPGRVEPGTWTVIVPVFQAPTPTPITVTVTLSFGRQGHEDRPGPGRDVVRGRPGWYRGDLHNHTTHSSDAFASGSALSPGDYPAALRRAGLDFVALTDHNVTTQNRDLTALASGEDVLVMGGLEMTNWFHGHATVVGLRPGGWLDWRQRPRGVPLGPYERRIDRFIAQAHRRHVYVAAAHPMRAHLAWQFFADAAADPSLLPDGLEVWNATFQPDDEAALATWDELLRRGHRVVANGGSDLHGVDNTEGIALGTPTTVVYAERLATDAVVAALKQGRGFITARPDGPELYLTATGPDEQREMVGGTIRGPADALVRFSVVVRAGAGRALTVLRDGVPVRAVPITEDEQTVALDQRIAAGGYVRAELRGAPSVDPLNPLAGRQGMQALTNPIYLARAE